MLPNENQSPNECFFVEILKLGEYFQKMKKTKIFVV
jgi:hypothetical protein